MSATASGGGRVVVLRAWYGDERPGALWSVEKHPEAEKTDGGFDGVDVTREMAEHVSPADGALRADATNSNFGDPCPGARKALAVEWRPAGGGGTTTTVAREGERLVVENVGEAWDLAGLERRTLLELPAWRGSRQSDAWSEPIGGARPVAAEHWPVVGLVLTARYQDQGWGNRKGGVMLAVREAEAEAPGDAAAAAAAAPAAAWRSRTAEHQSTEIVEHFGPGHPMVTALNARAGAAALTLHGRVGGGGGHSLRIEGLQVVAYALPPAAAAGLTLTLRELNGDEWPISGWLAHRDLPALLRAQHPDFPRDGGPCAVVLGGGDVLLNGPLDDPTAAKLVTGELDRDGMILWGGADDDA